MVECILQYKDQENECFCNKLKECHSCNNKDNRKSDEICNVGIGEFCTCRTCGYAVRA